MMQTTTNISPTRMERLHQIERLHTAKRAHKLLEDKYQQMVRTFSDLIKQNRTLRKLVEDELTKTLHLFMGATTHMTTAAIDDALNFCRQETTCTCTTQNIMGLMVPHIEVNSVKPTNTILLTTPANFDQAIILLQKINATLIELANLEKTCNILADEIQKVRRRINSLEYSMIPNIQNNIKFITMKLDENQRETQIRMIKIKDMQNDTNN